MGKDGGGWDFFFKLLSGCSMANFEPFSRDSLTNLMLITEFVQVRPEGHQEPHNEVGSLSLAKCLKVYCNDRGIVMEVEGA